MWALVGRLDRKRAEDDGDGNGGQPEPPAPHVTLGETVQRQHERAVADFFGGDYGSPAGVAKELPGAGEEWGTATRYGGAVAVPQPSPEEASRVRVRRRLLGRIRRRDDAPSDVELLVARYRREHKQNQ